MLNDKKTPVILEFIVCEIALRKPEGFTITQRNYYIAVHGWSSIDIVATFDEDCSLTLSSMSFIQRMSIL